MTYNIIQISNKIISMAEVDLASGGEMMSNLKLQKLLYYQQGYHLAVFGTPLFEDEIEAWTYGPVVPAAYNHFKKYGGASLPLEVDAKDVLQMSDEEENLFGEVYEAYREFSAIGLANQTHKEAPWRTTAQGEVISKEVMKRYFETLV